MISVDTLQEIIAAPDQGAWDHITSYLYNLYSAPFAESVVHEILHREKHMSYLETLLAGSSWNLWDSFESIVPKTSDQLIEHWNQKANGKAIFIIDGLSLRELPFILEGAAQRGYRIHQSRITASSLPSETTFFAKSLGFPQRSALENNQAGTRHLFPSAKTDCLDLPWSDCISRITPDSNWVLWHAWFDKWIHEYSAPGKGLRQLITKSEVEFSSDSFWGLVDKLAQGRQVYITSDHGYAATGDFYNVTDKQANYLKETYKSQRYAKADLRKAGWMPPIDIALTSEHGSYSYVLGRRKWRSGGGYPTLAHGGMSLMETLVPFLEISK
ncbi:hypothetical protein [Neobacillus niacini]|uniref:hypothetical protein n=1 Tax=Neobacillus niacini TaxID=86668 RepID=UPI00398303F2